MICLRVRRDQTKTYLVAHCGSTKKKHELSRENPFKLPKNHFEFTVHISSRERSVDGFTKRSISENIYCYEMILNKPSPQLKFSTKYTGNHRLHIKNRFMFHWT